MLLHAAMRLTLDPTRPDVIAVVGGGGKSSAVFRLGLDLARAGHRAVITHTARIAAFQTAWAPAVVEVPGPALPYADIACALDAHGVCLLTGPVVGDRRAGLPPELVDELAGRAQPLGLHALSVEADGSKMRPAKAPAAHEPVLPATTTILAPVLGLDAVGAEITPRTFHRAELVREVLGLPPEAAGANPAADPFRQTRLTPRHAGELLVHAAGGAKARPPGARLLPIFNKADQPLRLAYGRLAAGGLAQAGAPSLLAAVGRTEGAPVVERWGEVAVVILAAGAATRFGSPKQLAAVNGRPMLLSALAAAAALSGPIHVITGAHVGPVQEALAHLPPPLAHQLGGRLRVVHNPQWASGQASSLHASIHSLRANTAAAIWMPVDQPYLEATLLTQLVGAWRRGADLAAPVADGILRGAPALFDRRLWPELLAIRGDSGGRRVLQQHAAAVTPIPTSAASLQDIDTPQQLT